MIDLSSLFAGLTFFRQKRLDGGIRSGIMLGENTVLDRFEEGEGDDDPALIWSVDLRCSGKNLPDTTEGAQRWLLDNEDLIQDGFRRYADYLRAGSDVTGPYLLQWSDFQSTPPGVEMVIVCGAMRRVDALLLGSVIEETGKRWRELILSLTPGQPSLT
jgi:hypothetical protein